MKQKNRAAFFMQLVHLLLQTPTNLVPVPVPVTEAAVHHQMIRHLQGEMIRTNKQKPPIGGFFVIQIGRPSLEGLFI